MASEKTGCIIMFSDSSLTITCQLEICSDKWRDSPYVWVSSLQPLVQREWPFFSFYHMELGYPQMIWTDTEPLYLCLSCVAPYLTYRCNRCNRCNRYDSCLHQMLIQHTIADWTHGMTLQSHYITWNDIFSSGLRLFSHSIKRTQLYDYYNLLSAEAWWSHCYDQVAK